MSVDGLGNVYVANPGLNTIQKINLSTSAFSDVLTGLNNPADVVVENDTSLLISEYNTGLIKRRNLSSNTTSTLASGLNAPTDIFRESDTTILVAEYDGGKITRVHLTSGVKTTVVTPGGGPHGIARDMSGNLYVTQLNLGKILKFTPSLDTSTFATGLSSPAFIELSNGGLSGTDVVFSSSVTGTPTPTVTYSHASGSFFSVGTTTVTATATNNSGSVNCSFTVTVNPTITATAGANGSINPSGDVIVNSGANQQFTLFANTGYHVDSVIVNGVKVDSMTSYTFTNVTANHTIRAVFAINTYTLTYTAGANGTLTGTLSQTVNHGASGTQVAAVPNTGYHFVNWSDNSTSNPRTDANVTANISVTANFAINTFSVTASVTGGNGTITPESQTVNYNANATVTISPATGYHLATLTDNANDVFSQVSNNQYTISNVTANHSIVGTFAINTYSVTASVTGGNGTITPASQTVDFNTSATVTSSPATGYHLATLTDNANDVFSQVSNNQYTISNVTANHTIVGTFAIITYSVTASVTGGNGTITPTGQTVNYNANATVTISPSTGYHLASLTDNTQDVFSQVSSNQYTVSNVTADHSIVGTFAINTYTLTVNATNGTVTKNLDQPNYNHGTQVILTANPAIGYHFVDWKDDLSGTENPDTIIMDGNKTVTANFEINTYAIIADVVGNGDIDPSDTTEVDYGDLQMYEVTPGDDSHLDSIVVDGVRTDSLESYTFDNVSSAHTITAYFSINYYTLTTQITGGGTITPVPSGNTYAHGTEVMLVATPNANFNFAGWSGDTAETTRRNDTLIVTMDSAKAIRAIFTIQTFTITVTQGANGTISPVTTTVNYGTNQTFTITPDSNFKIDKVLVDGNDVGKENTYTFSNVTTNHIITATFKSGTQPPSITVLVPNGREVWRVGETYTISWSKVNVTSVKVEYSIDTARTWIVIISSTTATDMSWTIPNLPAGVTLRSALVRISSESNSMVKDESNAPFIIQTLIQQSNSGTNRHLNDVFFFPKSSVGWAVGDGATILKTTDYGITWISQTSNTGVSPNVEWIGVGTTSTVGNLNSGIVVGREGNSAIIMRTGDGGSSWGQSVTIPEFRPNGFGSGFQSYISGGATNIKGGYYIVADSGKIYRSEYGDIWTKDVSPTRKKLTGVSYAGTFNTYYTPVFFAVGDDSVVLRVTVNPGITPKWNLYGNTYQKHVNDVSFPNVHNQDAGKKTGWIVGNNGTILKTINGAQSWTLHPSVTDKHLNGITMSVDDNGIIRGWIVGNNGTILKYTPSTAKAKWRTGVQSDENEWTQVESGTDKDLTVATVTENGSFVTVGDSGVALNSQAKTLILSSPIGGGNYIAGQSLPITWSSDGVEFVKIEYSADSGQTWLSVADVVSASAGSYNWITPSTAIQNALVSITDIEDLSVNTTSASTFSLSPDISQFRTFRESVSDFTTKAVKLKYKKGTLAAQPNVMTAVENVFSKQVSKALYPKGRTFLGIEQTNKDSAKQYAWMLLKKASEFTAGFKSEHTGQSYPLDYLRNAAKGTKKKLSKAVKFTSALNNPAVAQGILLKLNILASDSGVTPTGFGALEMDTNVVLAGRNLKGQTLTEVSLYLDSIMTYWKALGVDTTEEHQKLGNFALFILKPINDGFYAAMTSGNYTVDSAQVVAKKSYAVTLSGVKSAEELGIVKRNPNARQTPLQFTPQTNAPTRFALEQNYPNPFNPMTTIRFEVGGSGLVSLKIYNILGQEVATLLNNEAMEEGEHEIQFDASKLTSGVYFYRLTSTSIENNTTTSLVKKMVLMK